MCGIFGVYRHSEAAQLAVYGLYGLQHRGQESAGVVSSDGINLHSVKGMGLVSEVFGGRNLQKLPGDTAVGHVRYSTSGSSNLSNAGPFTACTQHGEIALAHNGNLVNGPELREELEKGGAIFSSTTDSEVILHIFARSEQGDPLEAMVDAVKKLRGAFSLVVLTENSLIGVRDPCGFRPLVLGERDGSPILASESSALDLLQAKFIRELEVGEFLVLSASGARSFFPFKEDREAPCIFEHVYFARPDSRLFGRVVFPVRVAMGRTLAVEQPVEADAIVPVPDSGIAAALGYSEESGIPVMHGLIRNHYVGRTFIAPRQAVRDISTRLKLNAVPELFKGKRIVLVDDSLVRGTTSRKIVRLVREAGASEVHLRLSSPPIVRPCVYGIDTPVKEELLASSLDIDAIRSFVEVDSIGYLSPDGMLKAAGRESRNACWACFGGDYPVKWAEISVKQRRLFDKERR